MKTSPLADTEDMVKNLLENQADPLKVFKPLSYDEMKSALQEWLSPEDEEEEDSIISEPAEDFDSDTKEEPKSNYSLSTKPQKKTTTEKFDDLFGDDDDDDLPF